jgi:hypothetical protein
MKRWLRWFFVTHGVVGSSASPKILIKVGGWAIAYNSKPFRSYWPNGPSLTAYKYHAGLHPNLRYFTCKVCKAGCWGYKQFDHCGSWKCFKVIDESKGGAVNIYEESK